MFVLLSFIMRRVLDALVRMPCTAGASPLVRLCCQCRNRGLFGFLIVMLGSGFALRKRNRIRRSQARDGCTHGGRAWLYPPASDTPAHHVCPCSSRAIFPPLSDAQ